MLMRDLFAVANLLVFICWRFTATNTFLCQICVEMPRRVIVTVSSLVIL